MVLDSSLTSALTPELRDIVQEIEAHAKNLGLDFFTTIFEMVDYQQMNTRKRQPMEEGMQWITGTSM